MGFEFFSGKGTDRKDDEDASNRDGTLREGKNGGYSFFFFFFLFISFSLLFLLERMVCLVYFIPSLDHTRPGGTRSVLVVQKSGAKG